MENFCKLLLTARSLNFQFLLIKLFVCVVNNDGLSAFVIFGIELTNCNYLTYHYLTYQSTQNLVYVIWQTVSTTHPVYKGCQCQF